MKLVASLSGARHPLSPAAFGHEAADEPPLPGMGAADSADRVVLVPCSGSSAKQWEALCAEMAGFRPVPFELYGHGARAGWHGDGALTLAREAASIAQLCPDGAPFHLVGHSYGGAVALRFALSAPGRLRSLTLSEPSCFHLLDAMGADAAALQDEIRQIASAVNRGVLTGDYRGGMRTFIDYWSGAGTWDSMSPTRQVRFAALLLHVAHQFCGLFEEETSLDDYRAVDVPTLILCGTRSPAPSRAIARLLAETLPRVRHRTIDGAGHMAPITHPAAVNRPILEHLRLHRSDAPPPIAIAAQ